MYCFVDPMKLYISQSYFNAVLSTGKRILTSLSCLIFLCFCVSAMLDEDEEDRVDETALQQLTEMGFPESRAIKALRLNQ